MGLRWENMRRLQWAKLNGHRELRLRLRLKLRWYGMVYGRNHRRRTCDGYFRNSLRLISYLGYFWDIFILVLKTKSFFVKTTHKCSKPWKKDSQCQDGCYKFGRKYPKCLKIFRPNSFAKAQKFWISLKKVFIGRPWDEKHEHVQERTRFRCGPPHMALITFYFSS